MHLGKWRAVVNTVMNDRALLHVISLVKKADTSCAIMFTGHFITVTSRCSLVSHASNRGCLDSLSGQSTQHL
jgi:hypothetical protein